jgi:hypothetical protein
MDNPEFNLESSVINLYHIILQYYTLLKIKNHPMKQNMTDVMDLLINYRKTEKERTIEENTRQYDEIHSIAYKKIEEIFNYDQKIDEENGIKTEAQKLEVGYKGQKDAEDKE